MDEDPPSHEDTLRQLAFRWPWRPYQARVLKAVEAHLSDQRLHVVAAPGSGKTTLGLEIFRRLGRPAVVLSPTRTIRDQWLTRLRDFLRDNAELPPSWTSRNLDAPGYLTSLTYQALHTRYRASRGESSGDESAVDGRPNQSPSSQELAEVITRFREAGVGTLILDEAHHLRQEWWKALEELCRALHGVKLVALTATPPYDVAGFEWRRYERLCGPIDEEISVPELVRSGTLCPHQDYVWSVAPSQRDADLIRSYDRHVEQTTAELLADKVLLDAVEAHPWVATPRPDPADVLEHPELAIALLVLLRARSHACPPGLLRLVDCRADELPRIDRRWWQVLVQHYLYGDTWSESTQRDEHREELKKRLRKRGLLWRRELRIAHSRPVTSRLSLTSSKIDACVEIHRLERATRGRALRQVILTDFIRDDDQPRLGAWPIYRALVNSAGAADAARIALLTGRLVVIHRDRLHALRLALGDGASALEHADLPVLPMCVRVSVRGSGSGLVRPLTKMLGEGEVDTLVGTRALLGEGWDAPAVNSLILASFVGSFMLTNQMRGRAIRSDPAQPSKASSIWHLVAFDASSPTGRADVEDLQRRFEMFVGLAAERNTIESGIQRLSLPKLIRKDDLSRSNDEARRRLAQHASLAERWLRAVDAGQQGLVVPSVQVEQPPTVRPLFFRNTLRYLLYSAVQSFVATASYVMQSASGNSISARTLFWLIVTACGAGLAFTLPKLMRALWLWLRHLPVDGSLRQIGLALRDALCQADLIKTAARRLRVRSEEVAPGEFAISIVGGTFFEQSLFSDCLAELLGPIENPRYMLTRHAASWPWRRLDYHAVPLELAVNKERATLLWTTWSRRLGPTQLIYTRKDDGRRALLQARGRAFSGKFLTKAQRRDRWQ